MNPFAKENTDPSNPESPPSSSSLLASSMNGKETQQPESTPSSSMYPPLPDKQIPISSSSSHPPPDKGSAEKWGTHVMGTPAVPTCHPDNKKAAFWGATGDQAQYHHQPYLHYHPIDRKTSSTSTSMESILHKFNSFSTKAETMAHNIWHSLKTGSSVTGDAWGKVNLKVKAISGGGFENLYKQTFTTYPNETLKKTFACYLSTTTGPVAGTLYLSNAHVAFCSDRPLSFTAPSGQITWSYYKVMLPLGKIGAINPVVMRENPSERYLQIVSIDGHDFWFMGFVNYEKACKHLSEGLSNFVAPGLAVNPSIV